MDTALWERGVSEGVERHRGGEGEMVNKRKAKECKNDAAQRKVKRKKKARAAEIQLVGWERGM